MATSCTRGQHWWRGLRLSRSWEPHTM